MPTASYLIADMQVKLGDPSGNIFSSDNLLNWLNEAQTEFCQAVMPLRQVDATTIGTGFQRFPIPSDKIMIDGVFTRNSIGMKMKALPFDAWNNQVAACPGATGKDSDSWTEIDQTLYVYPAYGCAPATTVISQNVSPTVTTIPVASTSGFKPWGRLLLKPGAFFAGNVEEVEYSSIDATNFYGVTRGLGGTVAGSHFTKGGTNVIQCDLWMVYRRTATTMTQMTDTPEIKSCWHEHLQIYAMYLAYQQVGEQGKAQAMYQTWQDALEGAKYSAMREYLGTMHLHDMETEGFNHLNGPR
jgi:hypothetical protein